MKFGKTLEVLTLPKYRGYYIQYRELKQAVKVTTGKDKNQSSVQEVTHWTSSFLRCGPNPEVLPEARLQEVLSYELERVSRFAILEEDAICSQLERLEEDCNKETASEDLKSLRDRRDELGEHIVQLKSFSQVNFTGFRKITKKFDKCSKSSVSPWFMAQVVRAGFVTLDFDRMLPVFNRICMALLRRTDEPLTLGRAGGNLAEDDALGEITRQANECTFLVPHKDSVLVRIELAKRMRLLPEAEVAGGASTGDFPPLQTARPNDHPRVTSVFFDRPDDLQLYRQWTASSKPMDQPDGAGASFISASFDASWHIRHCGSDTVSVVYEHTADERRTEVTLQAAAVPRLLAGESVETSIKAVLIYDKCQVTATSGQEGRDAAIAALRGIRDMLGGDQSQNRMRPVAKASYQRRVFREESSGIIACLDEDVRIALVSKWDDVGRSSEYFAYDLLTIYTPEACLNSKTPTWLSHIIDIVQPVVVPRFTKAAHALARYYAIPRGFAPPDWHRTFMDGSDNSNAAADANEASEVHSVPGQESDINELVEAAPMTQLPAPRQPADDCLPETLRRKVNPAANDIIVRDPGADANSLRAPLLGVAEHTSDFVESAEAATREPNTATLAERFVAWTFGRTCRSGAPQSQAALPTRKAIVSVQPKTLYSNERTFLEWIHFATIFAALGIGMLHNPISGCSGGQWGPHCKGDIAVGRFLLLVSIFMVAWSLHTFNWRADALDRKEIRNYHDPVGPCVFILGLLVALVYASLRASGALGAPAAGISA